MANPLSFSLFSHRNRPLLFGLILLAIAAASIWSLQARRQSADVDLRAEMLDQAVALARTIHPDEVAALSFTSADKGLPEFQRLRQQMMGYETITNYRGIYTLALRESQLIFGPESYAEDDPQASPPGTVYLEPGEEDFAIFETGVAIVEGPFADEYGDFISALAPVLDPRTSEVLMVVGIDIETADYEAALLSQGLQGLLPVFALGAVLLAAVALTWWRDRLPAEQRARLRFIEIYALAIFGLAATFIAAQAFSDAEVRSTSASFHQLAEAKAQLIIKAFDNLQDHRLGSIVQFFTGSQFVERSEFRVFVAPLIEGSAIQALEWVPIVPLSEKSDLEAQVRREGILSYAFWQLDPAGVRETASPRAIYYPVLYVLPLEGNQAALGFDVGSETTRLTALENARASGLPAATDPIFLVQDEENKASILIFAPVVSNEDLQQTQDGFAVAVVKLETFLKSALFLGPVDDASAVVELYQLHSGEGPRFVASTSSSHSETHDEDSLQPDEGNMAAFFPLFAFDKAYVLEVHPGPEFPAAAYQAGVTTILAGLVFTALITTFATYILRRRDDLASQVQVRTDELRESEASLAILLDTLGDAVFITRMPERHIEYVNRAVTDIFGYQADEVVGKTTEMFYAPGVYAQYGQKAREAIAGHQSQVRAEVELRHKDGHTIWGEMNATIRYHSGEPATLFTVVRDISERIQTKEQIESQLKRLAGLHSIDVAITSSIDLQMVLDVVLEQSIEQLGMDAACVLLFDQETQTLTFGAGRGFRSRSVENIKLKLGESLAGKVALNREPIHVNNPSEAPEFTQTSLLGGQAFAEYYAAPLIAKGKVSGVLEVFKKTAFEGDTDWWGFLNTLAHEAAIAVDSARLLEDLKSASVDVVTAYDATIEGWSLALDLRDRETKGHTQRVTEMTLKLARAMGMSEEERIQIRRGGLLHDIGKIGIPDSILLKPGELNGGEWEKMRQHPQFAFDMLSPITYLFPALDIPYCHHEKWDGTGYPRGLKGNQIPLAARIFAVADVYDALISDRPYRKAQSKQDALQYIREQRGKHFDPKVVDLFLKEIASE